MADTITPEQACRIRVEDALGKHDVSWDDRAIVQDGWLAAGDFTAKWEDLAPEVQAKIEFLEKQPLTSWDDPADAPMDEA